MRRNARLAVGIAAAAVTAGLSFVAAAQDRALVPHISNVPEPGATPGVVLTNISQNPPDGVSVFPMVTLNPKFSDLVIVAWRRFGTPVDTDGTNRLADCHVSISTNAGDSYTDVNLMPYLDTDTKPDNSEDLPRIRACNGPWATIGPDGTIFAGGATTSSRPDLTPKAGRAGVVVSTDRGKSWSRTRVGIRLDKLAPGLKGLGGGMAPGNTPWDNTNGVVDPQTGTFYSAAGNYVAASDDKGLHYGTVYSGHGFLTASNGVVAEAATMRAGPGCPCLTAFFSTDKGKSWTASAPIAKAADYNPTGTVRYPILASDPAHPGHYAIAVYAPDHDWLKVYYTEDSFKTVQVAAPQAFSKEIAFTSVNQATAAYDANGRILVTWRAYRNVAAHNTFVAMLDGGKFGPSIKVTPTLSIDPPSFFSGWYTGDFTNWVVGNQTDAFVVFTYSPQGTTPNNTFVARVPLNLLK